MFVKTEFNNVLISAHEDFQKGNLENAKLKLEGLLSKEPGNCDVLFMLGVIYGIEKRHADAKFLLERAVKKQPNNSIINFNLAKAYSELGLDLESIKYHKKTVLLSGTNIEAWINYGNTLIKLKEFKTSINCYENALKINNKSIQALVNKSIALSHMQKYEEAITTVDKALIFEPESASIFLTKGIIFLKNKKFEDAIFYFNKSIKLEKENNEAIFHRGLASQGLGKFMEAIDDFDRAIKSDTNKTPSFINKAVSLLYLNQIEEAKLLLKVVISQQPKNADAHYNLALILLGQCEFESGWNEYEYRFEASFFSSKNLFTNLKRWDGNKKINKLLVWSEQGIGDQLLYLTILRDIDFDFRKITLLLPPKLSCLVSRSFGEIKIITSIKANEIKNYDAHLPIGSLGKLYRKNLENFDNKKPLLSSYSYNSSRVDDFIGSLEPKAIKVGLSWKSSNSDNGFAKSIDLKLITSLEISSNINFINLQYGEVSNEISDSNNINKNKIYNVPELDLYNNLEDLAVLIAKCDIIITTSNTTAHLAGALGKETILLLPFAFGRYWYWNDINGVSIWYPSIRIFRQKEQGNWNGPINETDSYFKNKYG